ncbi:MAG: pyridoxamine 5'-phosphate oxidase family protein, partial [Eggerthellaceae bacterium]|nr:pyridoxamine 5'-phosphate oxidase family protein [Eggerthellaceae bacterium]
MHSFYPMRRHKQQLSQEKCFEILEKGSSGTLALLDKQGFPYSVPLSYVFFPGKAVEVQIAESQILHPNGEKPASAETQDNLGSIYFHSALEGHKIDAIRNCAKASFCVIAADDVIPEKFTTAYRSVIVFGEVRVVKDDTNRKLGLELLGRKYSPNFEEAMQSEI